MPMKSKRPCRYPDCPNLTDGRYCEKHKALYPDLTNIHYFKNKKGLYPNLPDVRYCENRRVFHTSRPSAAKRGYDSKWQKARKGYLNKHPLCVRCQAKGIYTQATVVDHIIPHRGDKNLFWERSNWQALCKKCHDKKTWTEDCKIK